MAITAWLKHWSNWFGDKPLDVECISFMTNKF
jgi:hypothetical protein